MARQLKDAVDKKGLPLRPLTPDESTFVLHEQLMCKIDYRYWSERWAIVAKKTQETSPLHPRWRSQEIFLAKLAKLEEDRAAYDHPDGVLVNVLKGRQLGLSTESEAILAHRITSQTSVRGLVAGDVPEQSEYLFGMAELIVDHLPWWLKPQTRAHQTGKFLAFATGTSLRVAAGKSQRGGLQDRGGAKGNLGRGKTFGIGHISEVSTWERPEQLRDGLEPGIPEHPRTFFVRESTAKGRNDFWHNEWRLADQGKGRWTNIFIPWYSEPTQYRLPPPDGWEPNEHAKAHAEAVERTSAQFMLGGETVRLNADQLHWWERKRTVAEDTGELAKFYEEYPATPEESFQNSGRSIFTPKVLELLKRQERIPIAVLHVEPMKTIDDIRAWEREAGVGVGAGG